MGRGVKAGGRMRGGEMQCMFWKRAELNWGTADDGGGAE